MTSLRWTPARVIGVAWLVLLAASHLVRLLQPYQPVPAAEERLLTVSEVRGRGTTGHPVRVAFLDVGVDSAGRLPVVLLHGSPGSNGEVWRMAELLAASRRAVAPDLPGFGASTRDIPDYSIRAHARYVEQLLDSLAVPRAHLVGFSLGGGVAIEMAGAHPERVASLTLLSSVGVQEYELLGDYHLNHAIHGLQLAGLWAFRELVPHFGWFDGAFFGVEYARNFYDTDQRPLRGILERWAGPTLILQGDRDVLVPPAIAREHGRIVPQAVVQVIPGDHFMAFARAGEMARWVGTFLADAESGRAPHRAEADPDRLARAALPFDPRDTPRPTGFSLVILLLLLAAATLVSEDLACIAGGLLVSRGTIGFVPAVAACAMGIILGDLLLFAVGRWGRPLLRRAPLRWVVNEADIERSSRWFASRGLWIVLATRFMPGTRLPTYLAAGALNTRLPLFIGAFIMASLLWVPLLVGAASFFGGRLLEWFSSYGRLAGAAFVAGLLLLFVLVRLAARLATWRGRRLLLSRWRRLTRWEFWPLWAFYPPVVLWILWLGIRHRSMTLFTAANPAMPAGGLAGESKQEILQALRRGAPVDGPGRVASSVLLPASLPGEARLELLRQFIERERLAWPVVLKPDVGERGLGVDFAADAAEARRYLTAARYDVIAQERVDGEEFGVFYYRLPGEASGRIFAVTVKRFPSVTGDGARTLEELILADDRAVCSARFFLRAHADRAEWIPPAGELVPLTRLGTHSRGALFLDGAELISPELTAAVDALSRGYAGFWFGRYDLKAHDAATLRAGGPFTVLELNGVSSEATSMYDPRHSLLDAYRTLFAQWRLAYRIGARNAAAGARPATVREVVGLLRHHRRSSRLVR